MNVDSTRRIGNATATEVIDNSFVIGSSRAGYRDACGGVEFMCSAAVFDCTVGLDGLAAIARDDQLAVQLIDISCVFIFMVGKFAR